MFAKLALKAIGGGAACSICLFVPFAAFQTYGYYNICLNAASDRLRPWCMSKVPNMYGFLQSHYWGVGFLRYFEVKQLPNFLLASPILTIAILSIVYYASLLCQTSHSLGKTPDFKRNLHGKDHSQDIIISSNNSSIHDFKGNRIFHRLRSEKKAKTLEFFHKMILQMDSFIRIKREGYCALLVLPFILHLGFMTFMSIFVMHVQVATRFLSASPPIYWFASYVMLSPGPTSRRMNHVIWSYCIAYILLGSLLFSTFYPFT